MRNGKLIFYIFTCLQLATEHHFYFQNVFLSLSCISKNTLYLKLLRKHDEPIMVMLDDRETTINSAIMTRNNDIFLVFVLTIFSGLSACFYSTGDKSKTDKIIANSYSVASQQINYTATDSLNIQKDELTKIYTRAITEFIKAAYNKDKTIIDTLYFGKHTFGQPDDFPDIELPSTIEKTQIRIVAPEVGLKKQATRKSLFYVNILGWVDKERAEFVLVVFTNGAEHQYDYFINFNYNTSSNNYELEKIEFENYLNFNGQKPQRITIYKDGKYNDYNIIK